RRTTKNVGLQSPSTGRSVFGAHTENSDPCLRIGGPNVVSSVAAVSPTARPSSPPPVGRQGTSPTGRAPDRAGPDCRKGGLNERLRQEDWCHGHPLMRLIDLLSPLLDRG